MATYQEIKNEVRHNVDEFKHGVRDELLRYIVYVALAIIAIGIVIAFADAAFDALFRTAVQ